MSEKSTLGTFLVQSLLIVGMSLIMIRTGQMTGTKFLLLNIPYAGELGFVIGVAVAFAVFTVLYRGYSTYQNNGAGA